MTDPIIDELHRLREQALTEVGFDHHRFCERLREREQRSQKVVDPPPRTNSRRGTCASGGKAAGVMTLSVDRARSIHDQ
jgi:hypothetical protein